MFLGSILIDSPPDDLSCRGICRMASTLLRSPGPLRTSLMRCRGRQTCRQLERISRHGRLSTSEFVRENAGELSRRSGWLPRSRPRFPSVEESRAPTTIACRGGTTSRATGEIGEDWSRDGGRVLTRCLQFGLGQSSCAADAGCARSVEEQD